jgi:hypothetical protein
LADAISSGVLSLIFRIQPDEDSKQQEPDQSTFVPELKQQNIDEPLELLSQVGFAAIVGVSKQRIHQLKEAGALPSPIGLVDGGREVWSHEQAQQYAASHGQRQPN